MVNEKNENLSNKIISNSNRFRYMNGNMIAFRGAAQRGTVGEIRNDEDMPYNNEVDIIVNENTIPSYNPFLINQCLETHLPEFVTNNIPPLNNNLNWEDEDMPELEEI